jgi:hypothetical protein
LASSKEGHPSSFVVSAVREARNIRGVWEKPKAIDEKDAGFAAHYFQYGGVPALRTTPS